MTKATFWFAIIFCLWTFIAPQFAEWRFYYRTYPGNRENHTYHKVGDLWVELACTESYKADFMWSRLKWDFYYECVPHSPL